MQKKIFPFVAAILLLGSVFLGVSGWIVSWFGAGTGTSTGAGIGTGTEAIFVVDHSIKTEYGTPIGVRRAIDGDTVELVNGDRLRYIGIDAPEEFDPRKPVQCFAREAAAKNKELVEGRMVTFYKDISPRDRYGRWLGFVYLEDGTFVNLKLVESGFAFSYPYPPDISHADEFRAAEAEARANHAGLWAGCAVHHAPSGRSQTNSLGEP